MSHIRRTGAIAALALILTAWAPVQENPNGGQGDTFVKNAEYSASLSGSSGLDLSGSGYASNGRAAGDSGPSKLAKASLMSASDPMQLNRTSADDIWARTLGSGSFSEFWNYQVYLDNGMSLYIIFSVSNVSRFTSSVSGLRVSMYGLDGRNYEISREYPLEHLLQDTGEYKFSINPRQDNIWFRGKLPESHEMFINTAKDGHRFNIELFFEDIQPGFRVGDGMYDAAGQPMGIFTHIPYARVRGRVGINENIKDVEGTAYMDHTWQYQNAARTFESGYRFVQHTSPGNWDITYFLVPKQSGSNQVIGHRVASRNGSTEASPIRLTDQAASYLRSNQNYPGKFGLAGGTGDTVYFERTREIDRVSIISNLGWLARNAARSLMGGELFDHRGDGEIHVSGSPPKKGHYNYFIVK